MLTTYEVRKITRSLCHCVPTIHTRLGIRHPWVANPALHLPALRTWVLLSLTEARLPYL